MEKNSQKSNLKTYYYNLIRKIRRCISNSTLEWKKRVSQDLFTSWHKNGETNSAAEKNATQRYEQIHWSNDPKCK